MEILKNTNSILVMKTKKRVVLIFGLRLSLKDDTGPISRKLGWFRAHRSARKLLAATVNRFPALTLEKK